MRKTSQTQPLPSVRRPIRTIWVDPRPIISSHQSKRLVINSLTNYGAELVSVEREAEVVSWRHEDFQSHKLVMPSAVVKNKNYNV